MTDEIAKLESNLPVADIESPWGAIDDFGTDDFLITKVFQMQGLSKLVREEKARMGEWRDSVSNELLCAKEAEFEVIIFSAYRNILVSRLDPVSQKYKWVKTEALTPENSDFEFESQTMEGTFRRQMQYNYFLLPASDVNTMPLVLSLSSTKTKTAKRLATMMGKMKAKGLPSAAITFRLKSVNETNELGEWYGIEVSQGRPTTKEELQIAFDWYTRIKSDSRITVHEASEMGEPSAVQGNSSSEPISGHQDDIPF